jgi:methyltransferase (TIGR00027 family)
VNLTKLAVIQHALKSLGLAALPDLSNAVGMAKLRYIQSIYESSERRNPDALVGNLLPLPVRWASLLQGKMQLSSLRLRPFYYYLIARTKYYDQIFANAINDNLYWIINIGCGTDTRAYRFAVELTKRKKHVIECDQQQSISVKQKLAKKKWCTEHISYIPIDINDESSWSELEFALAEMYTPILIMMEGVSSYVSEDAFRRFLKFISVKASIGSRLTYDCKIRTSSERLGQQGRSDRVFRLPANKNDVSEFHEILGYELQNFESSSELTSRILPGIVPPGGFFTEDCLLDLIVRQGKELE